ncbi:hypothetical protein ACJX0J_017933, partial [Zea mays]
NCAFGNWMLLMLQTKLSETNRVNNNIFERIFSRVQHNNNFINWRLKNYRFNLIYRILILHIFLISVVNGLSYYLKDIIYLETYNINKIKTKHYYLEKNVMSHLN